MVVRLVQIQFQWMLSSKSKLLFHLSMFVKVVSQVVLSMLLQSRVQINSQVQPSHTILMKTFMVVIAKSTRKHKSFLMKAPKLTASPLVVLSLRTNCSSSLHWNIKRIAILQPIMLVHRAIS